MFDSFLACVFRSPARLLTNASRLQLDSECTPPARPLPASGSVELERPKQELHNSTCLLEAYWIRWNLDAKNTTRHVMLRSSTQHVQHQREEEDVVGRQRDDA